MKRATLVLFLAALTMVAPVTFVAQAGHELCLDGSTASHTVSASTGFDVKTTNFGSTGASIGFVFDTCESLTPEFHGDGEYESGVALAWLENDHHTQWACFTPTLPGQASFSVGSDGDGDGTVSPDYLFSPGPDYLGDAVISPDCWGDTDNRCYSFSDGTGAPGTDGQRGFGAMPAGLGPRENLFTHPNYNGTESGWFVFVAPGVTDGPGAGVGIDGIVTSAGGGAGADPASCDPIPPVRTAAYRRVVIVAAEPAVDPTIVVGAGGTCVPTTSTVGTTTTISVVCTVDNNVFYCAWEAAAVAEADGTITAHSYCQASPGAFANAAVPFAVHADVLAFHDFPWTCDATFSDDAIGSAFCWVGVA